MSNKFFFPIIKNLVLINKLQSALFDFFFNQRAFLNSSVTFVVFILFFNRASHCKNNAYRQVNACSMEQIELALARENLAPAAVSGPVKVPQALINNNNIFNHFGSIKI